MNIRQAKEEIKNTFRAYSQKNKAGEYLIPESMQRPVLLMGPPGIGKTRIMEQIASELGIGLVSYALTHHTRQSALGLPAIEEKNYDGRPYSVTRYTMSEIIDGIYRHMEETGHREGILFLDEINCISETLVPAMLQLLQQKRFGSEKIPSGWMIAAAGNPPEYNRSARRFDIVTLDRIRLIELEADVRAFKSYAADAGIHGAIMSFLDIKPESLFSVKKTVDGISYATPRGWEDLSLLIKVYESLGVPVDKELIYGFIHDEDMAEDMAVYLNLYNRYKDDYHVEDILRGEAPPSVYERLLTAAYDEKVCLIRLLLDALELRFSSSAEGNPSGSPSHALKAAFDFIVETMGEGNELLLFVTGLTDSTNAVLFMLDNPSEEYLKYSEELFGDAKRAAILKDIG